MSAKLLVVEDDADIRRNLKRLFESEGYSVEIAENGKIALEALMNSADLPSVIILDLMMPIMDGFEFREEQEKIARISSIPVVIMTADGHIDEKKMRTKASAALKKPADAVIILDTVAKLCCVSKA